MRKSWDGDCCYRMRVNNGGYMSCTIMYPTGPMTRLLTHSDLCLIMLIYNISAVDDHILCFDDWALSWGEFCSWGYHDKIRGWWDDKALHWSPIMIYPRVIAQKVQIISMFNITAGHYLTQGLSWHTSHNGKEKFTTTWQLICVFSHKENKVLHLLYYITYTASVNAIFYHVHLPLTCYCPQWWKM